MAVILRWCFNLAYGGAPPGPTAHPRLFGQLFRPLPLLMNLGALSYIYTSRTFTMRLFFFPEIARSTGSGKLFNRPLETVHA